MCRALVRAHVRRVEALVEACARELGPLDAKKVLDIGCNDGSLLSFLRDRGARTFGIEPTDAADDAFALGHVISKIFPERRHRD